MNVDHKYDESLFENKYENIELNIKTEGLREVAQFFSANMKRTRIFLRLPSTISYFTEFFMRLQTWSQYQTMALFNDNLPPEIYHKEEFAKIALAKIPS